MLEIDSQKRVEVFLNKAEQLLGGLTSMKIQKFSSVMVVLAFMMVMVGCATTTRTAIGDGYTTAQKAYERGDYATAQTYYEKYIEKNPTDILTEVALYYLASSYAHQGDVVQAQKTYQELISQFSGSKWARWAQSDLEKISM